MRIAVDAMGGDHAPTEVVKGALVAAQAHPGHEILLVGEEDALKRLLETCGPVPKNVRVVAAFGVVGMDEEPVSALRRKPNCSMARCIQLVAAKEAEATLSAGSTGAAVAAAAMGLNRLPGVRRPGIAATLPTLGNPCILIDVGANINCRPINLYQYAVMGVALSTLLFNRTAPKVGLLSIGEEEGKGNSLVKETRRLFQKEGGLNFAGNVEGRDIFSGQYDVVVCEGFVGNAVLKVAEGLAESLFRTFQKELETVQEKAAGGGGALRDQMAGAMRRLKQRTDYAEAGGAPLMGLDGVVLICHGRSDARAITNAVSGVVRMCEARVNERIAEALAARSA